MKIQLDTTAKVIRVEETINLGEFFKAIKDILPSDQWKEYKLETNTVINWSYPYIFYKEITAPQPYPWWQPAVYTIGANTLIDTGKGSSVFCIEY
ncbi:MAG: hypothetical protein WC998_06725 [Candidatus Paceibacterota bacterium]|jgi:hypothetical protein